MNIGAMNLVKCQLFRFTRGYWHATVTLDGIQIKGSAEKKVSKLSKLACFWTMTQTDERSVTSSDLVCFFIWGGRVGRGVFHRSVVSQEN